VRLDRKNTHQAPADRRHLAVALWTIDFRCRSPWLPTDRATGAPALRSLEGASCCCEGAWPQLRPARCQRCWLVGGRWLVGPAADVGAECWFVDDQRSAWYSRRSGADVDTLQLHRRRPLTYCNAKINKFHDVQNAVLVHSSWASRYTLWVAMNIFLKRRLKHVGLKLSVVQYSMHKTAENERPTKWKAI